METFNWKYQLLSILLALVLLRITASITGAKPRRLLGAFVSVLVATVLNILLDAVAARAGWWWHPALDRLSAPLGIYFAQQLVYSGAGGLIGWKIGHRRGMGGFCLFVAVCGLLGTAWHALVASATPIMDFGEGIGPRIADFLGWAAILFLAQVVMALIAGIRVTEPPSTAP